MKHAAQITKNWLQITDLRTKETEYVPFCRSGWVAALGTSSTFSRFSVWTASTCPLAVALADRSPIKATTFSPVWLSAAVPGFGRNGNIEFFSK